MIKEKSQNETEQNVANYTEHQAIAESSRCLMCDDAPCREGCPADVKVSEFLRQIRTGDFIGAARTIRNDNIFGSVCARICPTDRLCQKNCSNTSLDEPIDIPGLQKFVCDFQLKNEKQKIEKVADLDKKVAIIGAGPGGLAGAFELRKHGYQVTVFEANDFAGGMLQSGIPSYRLPREIIKSEINLIIDFGVKIVYNHNVKDLKELTKDFDAIYISVGLIKEKAVNIPGNDLPGVYYALDFLKQKYIDNKLSIGKSIAVIGGGDVAMDCARTAIRMDGIQDVYIVYRRSAKEMPAQDIEKEEAEKEGIIFQNLLAPAAIEGNQKVEKLICYQVKLGEPDSSGRRKPIIMENTRVEFEVDNVIFAIGQEADQDFYQKNPELKQNNKGLLEVNPETFETSIANVYAGGDIIGGMTAVESIGNAKKAAKTIHEKLSKGN